MGSGVEADHPRIGDLITSRSTFRFPHPPLFSALNRDDEVLRMVRVDHFRQEDRSCLQRLQDITVKRMQFRVLTIQRGFNPRQHFRGRDQHLPFFGRDLRAFCEEGRQIILIHLLLARFIENRKADMVRLHMLR